MKRTASRNKGFTIVEVLVAVGIMGIVALGVAEMFRQMAEQQRSVMQLMNKQDLKNSAIVALRDREGCKSSLENGSIPTSMGSPAPITKPIVNGGGIKVIELAKRYGAAAGDGLTVNNLQLLSQGANAINVPKPAIVRISYSRIKMGAPVTESFDIPVQVVPKAGSLVDTCWTDETHSVICTANGGKFNNSTGLCEYSKLCAGNYCLKDVPDDPEKGLCGPTGCTTNFSPQRCPRPGENSNFTMVIGIEKGTVICGPYNGL